MPFRKAFWWNISKQIPTVLWKNDLKRKKKTKAIFGSRKILKEKTSAKKIGFLMFGSMKNTKKISNIIKNYQNFIYF